MFLFTADYCGSTTLYVLEVYKTNATSSVKSQEINAYIAMASKVESSNTNPVPASIKYAEKIFLKGSKSGVVEL